MKQSKFLCVMCNKEFESKRSLMMHIRKAHDYVPTCPICGKPIKNGSIDDLLRHLRKRDEKHEELRKYLEDALMIKKKIKSSKLKLWYNVGKENTMV